MKKTYKQQHSAGIARANELYDQGVTPLEIIHKEMHSTSGQVYAMAMLERGKELEQLELAGFIDFNRGLDHE